MKGATQCARRVKQVFKTLRAKLGKVNKPQAGDPVSQLILGVFSRDAQEAKAREVLDTLRAMVVDYNELRVIPHSEIANAIGDYPDVRMKCEDMSRALNRIFALEHSVTLDHLAKMSKTEANRYLDAVPGLEAYTRARIRLLGLGLHAIPLDAAMWQYARREGLVDQKCTLEEAQAFLERQLDEEEAFEFVALLRKESWTECGGMVRKGTVTAIRSVPPDRTTRNMLQMVAQGNLVDAAVPEFEDPELVGGDEESGARGGAAAGSDGKAGKKAKKPSGKSRNDRKSISSKVAPPKAKSKPAEKRASAGAKSA
jgi:endonuclease III